MTDIRDKALDDHFGVCPHCRKNDGFINVGRAHLFMCHEHKVCWWVGENLFDSCKFQTKAEQRAIYDQSGVASYQKVKPFAGGQKWK
jgi:hypothetical protein